MQVLAAVYPIWVGFLGLTQACRLSQASKDVLEALRWQ